MISKGSAFRWLCKNDAQTIESEFDVHVPTLYVHVLHFIRADVNDQAVWQGLVDITYSCPFHERKSLTRSKCTRSKAYLGESRNKQNDELRCTSIRFQYNESQEKKYG